MKRQTGKGDIVRLDSYRYDTYNAEVEREQNTIGIRIAEARRENGLTLVALCDRLKAYAQQFQTPTRLWPCAAR